MIDFPRLVFHGSSLPPGTDSTELRKPKLEQPFFVGDSLDMAIWYMEFSNYGENINPSVFIFKMKESSKNLLFNIENYNDYKRLKTKFPNFINYLQYKLVGDETFYDAMNTIATQTCYMWFITPDDKFRKSIPYNDRWGKMTKLKVEVAMELGIVESSTEKGKRIISCTQEIEKILKANGSNDNSLTLIRRYAKARIYKEIYDLGFRIVKDGDTTTNRKNSRSEYAILDMDVFESGLNKSMSIVTARRKLKEIEKKFKDYENGGGIV